MNLKWNVLGNNGVECQTNCVGMARWWVSEPYITLWLEDEPLGYQPSRGPRVSFHLSYKGRNTRGGQFAFNLGTGWECSWMSSIGLDGFEAHNTGVQTNVKFDAAVYLPGGGVQRLSVSNQPIDSLSQTQNFFSQTHVVPVLSGLSVIGMVRRFPNGAEDQYLAFNIMTGHDLSFLLTARVDLDRQRMEPYQRSPLHLRRLPRLSGAQLQQHPTRHLHPRR